MSLTQATLIQRIRWHLGDIPWETTGTTADATGDVTVADGDDWTEGDVGEFQSDGDTFLVRSKAGSDLVSVRSYYGSTGATHATTGRVLKNPKYKFSEIANSIAEVIEYMLPWPRFYKVTADTVTPDPANKVWYDLAADALALVRVHQLYGASNQRDMQYGAFHKSPRVTFKRGLPATLVASGVGVGFPDGFSHTTNTVFIDYAAKITSTIGTGAYSDFTAGDAIVSAIEYATVALLQGSLELRRLRHSAEDPDPLRGADVFNRLFVHAATAAEKELRQKNPLMIGWDR